MTNTNSTGIDLDAAQLDMLETLVRAAKESPNTHKEHVAWMDFVAAANPATVLQLIQIARRPTSGGDGTAAVGSADRTIDTADFRRLSYAYAEALFKGTVPQTSAAWGALVEHVDSRASSQPAATVVAADEPKPYGWVQFIDGQQTQNFARDEAELEQVKEIAALFIKPGQTVHYVQVFDRATPPAPTRQPLADERARYDAWAADNLPQYFSGRAPTWETVESNVRAETWNAWCAALAQPIVSPAIEQQGGERAEASEFAHIDALSHATTRLYEPIYQVWQATGNGGWLDTNKDHYDATKPESYRRITYAAAPTPAAEAVRDADLLQLLRDARHRICNDAPNGLGDVPPLDNPTYGPLLRRLDALCAAMSASQAKTQGDA